MSDKPDQGGCHGDGTDAKGCRVGGADKKHPCADCSFCQWCSDDRCRLCLNRKGCGRRRLSLAEQIRLYDSLNRDGADEDPEE